MTCFSLLFSLFSFAGATVNAEAQSAVPLISLADGTEILIDAVDTDRVSNGITVYTSVYGETFTPSFEDGKTVEYTVSNDIVVDKNEAGSKGTYIPMNNVIVSASGDAIEKLKDLAPGDLLKVEGVSIAEEIVRYVQIGQTLVPYNKVNTQRGDSDVVLYDSTYGSSTGTNVWGTELTIDDGVITEIKRNSYENDSLIPDNGYVLSVQSSSEYNGILETMIENGELKVGDSAEIVIQEQTHLASLTTYNAMDPKTAADNPGGWDEANGVAYDGFRGGDQLIVYTEAYGEETTLTNPWGYEVTVDAQNRVVSVGGNDSEIPEDGYVLSGHGTKAEWLEEYAKLGSTVTLKTDAKEVLLMKTPELTLSSAQYALSVSEGLLQTAREMYMDVPYDVIEQKLLQAAEMLEAMESLLAEQEYDQLMLRSAELDEILSEIVNLTMESRKVEHRAIWIRPLETDIDQVRDHLTQIAEANLNQVYVETWWNGYTIYPSENSLAPHNPMYDGFDVLEAYLTVGEELGLEIHAWVENGFLEYNQMEEKEDWWMLRRDGSAEWVTGGYTFYWINLALPEVRQFLTDLYVDMVERYQLDGVQLDYIRYPDSYGTEEDWGYDDYTRTQFMEQYQTTVDPVKLYPGDDLWEEWMRFRMDIVTNFVREIVPQLKEVSPELAISAAVYSDFYTDPYLKLQEAGLWLQEGLLDNVFPMSYKLDAKSVVEDTYATLTLAGDHSYVTMGLGPQAGVAISELVNQANESAKIGSSGSGYFEFLSFFGSQYDVPLSQGVYRNSAIVPFSQPGLSVETLLSDLVRKIDDIYVPNQGMQEQEAELYKEELTTLVNRLNESENIDQEASELDDELLNIMDQISLDSQIEEQVKDRMLYDLQYAYHIVQIYNNKQVDSDLDDSDSDDDGDSTSTIAPSFSIITPSTGLPDYATLNQAMNAELEELRAELADAQTADAKADVLAKMQQLFNEYMLTAGTINVYDYVTDNEDVAILNLTQDQLSETMKEVDEQFKAAIELFSLASAELKVPQLTISLDMGNTKSNAFDIQLNKGLMELMTGYSIEQVRVLSKGFITRLTVANMQSDIAWTIKSTAAMMLSNVPVVASDIYDIEITAPTTWEADSVFVNVPLNADFKLPKHSLQVASIVNNTATNFTPNNGDYEYELTQAQTSVAITGLDVQFNDIDRVEAWAGAQIDFAASLGIIDGTGNGQFEPSEDITRAQLAKMMVQAFELADADQASLISDVPSTAWYSNFVKTVVEAGLMNVYTDGNFEPNKSMSRAEVTAVAARAMQKLYGWEDVTNVDEVLSTFKDADQIHLSLREDVALAVKHNLVIGYNGDFNAKDNITRAEVAVIIYRLLNN